MQIQKLFALLTQTETSPHPSKNKKDSWPIIPMIRVILISPKCKTRTSVSILLSYLNRKWSDAQRFFSSTSEQNSQTYQKKKKKKNHLTSQQPMTRERVSRCIFKCLCKEKRNPWEHEWPVGRTDLFKTSKLQAAQKQVPKKCQCPYLDNPPPSVCPGLWIRFTDPTSLCNQQSHRYNLFLIQHNKRMSLKHTLSTHPNNV